MIVPAQHKPIVMATRPVDFRSGHNALASIVQNELRLDPHSGVTVVFRSRRGDSVEIPVWYGTGPVLVYKRIDRPQSQPFFRNKPPSLTNPPVRQQRRQWGLNGAYG